VLPPEDIVGGAGLLSLATLRTHQTTVLPQLPVHLGLTHLESRCSGKARLAAPPKTCFLPPASPCNNHTLLLKELPPAPECSPSSLVFQSSWEQVSARRGDVETARAGERNHWNEAPVTHESPGPQCRGYTSFPPGPTPSSQAPGVLEAVSRASSPAASCRTVPPLTSTHQEQRPPMPSTLVRRTAHPLDGQVSEATCTCRTASPPRQA